MYKITNSKHFFRALLFYRFVCFIIVNRNNITCTTYYGDNHYLRNLLPSDKMAAQKMKNKIPARLYIYFPDGEISN